MKKIGWKPVWFDSLAAKCSCCLVRTPDISILIDPGAAEMQPGYPLSALMKIKYTLEARKAILNSAKEADLVVITHYHYDHHTLLTTPGARAEKIYEGKIIYAKDPNQYINLSQWKRARLFYNQLCRKFVKIPLEKLHQKPEVKTYHNPMEELPLARAKDWESYAERKKQLLAKGLKWFNEISLKYWSKKPWIPELNFKNLKVLWADRKEIKIGKTKVNFSEPRFHGLEFDRVGWVFSVSVGYGKEKFLYSSDLEGVQIEDYAEAIIKENPNVLILDGPATYLFGYLMTRRNLNRSVENLCKIVERTKAELIILDHHLLRDKRYKERLHEVYETADKLGMRVITAAEYLGKTPKILELTKK